MEFQLLSYINFLIFAAVAKVPAAPTLSDLYERSYNWVLNRGPKLITGLIVLFIGLWLIRMLRGYMKRRMEHRQVHSSLQPFFLSLTITGLHLILIILIMEIIGIELTVFTAIISAATVAAGLALSGTLQNFAGGIMILLLKPFELGDNIIAQGQDGVVSSIQVFYTVVITFDNKTVIIPNGKLFNEVIVNVSREGKRRLDVEIKLSYAFDPDQVKEVLTRSVKTTTNILVEPAMYVGVNALDPDGIRYTIRVWVSPTDFLNAKLDLQEQVIKDLKAAQIKLPGT